ncbi:hypothetical protein VPH209E381_0100 [Vibrio phage 209E38-1]
MLFTDKTRAQLSPKASLIRGFVIYRAGGV